MTLARWITSVKNTLGRGVFPHELSVLLELPWRRLVLSPSQLVHRLPLTSASHVLEVGSGGGYYSVAVARQVPEGRLELLDLQPEMLRKARTKLEEAGLRNVGYTATNAGEIPFPKNYFDVIYLVAVLGELDKPSKFLWEAHRVLKESGTLSISEHRPDPDFSPLAEVKSRVETEGFEVVCQHGPNWSYTANFRKVVKNKYAERRWLFASPGFALKPWGQLAHLLVQLCRRIARNSDKSELWSNNKSSPRVFKAQPWAGTSERFQP